MMHAMAIATPNTVHSEISVQTTRFGTLTVQPDKIITMTAPFLGFPGSRHFMLRPHSEESPFMWLQSLDEPALAFVVIPAAVLAPQYRPVVPEIVREELGGTPGGQMDILLILTIPKENPQGMTANLLGPLVINADSRLARQVLQDPTRYDACWPVFTVAPEEGGK
ncbi:MAG: flagellar assembly protein FliW [Thermodesulfobacteriota bacterium]